MMIAWAILITLAAVLAAVIRGYRASLRGRRERRHFQNMQWWGKR